jgi:hypothetical protein
VFFVVAGGQRKSAFSGLGGWPGPGAESSSDMF